jgi:hypothetical protein
MLRTMGADYALYLIYLRYAGNLCLAITLFNLVIMIPIYVSGDPLADDDYKQNPELSSMNLLTVLNITADESKMIFAYVIAVFIMPIFAFYMLYKFISKHESWKKKTKPNEPFHDIDIAKFSIEVKNLPIDEGVEPLQRRIASKMMKIYPPDPITGKSAFVKARVIGDYNYAYKKCKELRSLMDHLEFVIRENREKGTRR